ncbi:hypothetical protein BJX68DRAFT_257386 [Aspergillus pseudodeflectus]|uniref:3-hydroxyacyl-CoA dehydrogenase n=1 Tax=Aspergillus pseudodeflectus TaxID=176178 RepID=A0ABR4JU12_9EURO
MAIQTVAVIGAGMIGASWTALFIANGIRTIIYDPREDAEKSLSFVTFTMNLDNAVHASDIIQEITPEILQVKLDLLRAIDRQVNPTTLICSSTSGFRPSKLQPACPRNAHNFLIGHPFNPPHLIPPVESLGKRPVHVRTEAPGHIANRLQAALLREVFYLLGTGAAGVQDIEIVMEFGPGLRWGYAEKFLPYLTSWYAANDPVLDPELMEKWVRGTMEMADRLGDQDRGRIEARRDELLISLLNASSTIESDG